MNKPRGTARRAKPLGTATDAWWYEEVSDIDVFVQAPLSPTSRITIAARIEKRQIIGWLRRLGYTVEKTP